MRLKEKVIWQLNGTRNLRLDPGPEGKEHRTLNEAAWMDVNATYELVGSMASMLILNVVTYGYRSYLYLVAHTHTGILKSDYTTAWSQMVQQKNCALKLGIFKKYFWGIIDRKSCTYLMCTICSLGHLPLSLEKYQLVKEKLTSCSKLVSSSQNEIMEAVSWGYD